MSRTIGCESTLVIKMKMKTRTTLKRDPLLKAGFDVEIMVKSILTFNY
jgi:hypothetical protein